MRADQFLAKQYWMEKHTTFSGPDDAFLAGFHAMKEYAASICEQFNNPGLATLIKAICTADVDPVTGERYSE